MLGSSSCEEEQERSGSQEAGEWREALYKRRGNTFTTSEGRILRSSQVRRLKVEFREATFKSLLY